ncbi:MAG: NeuD/PglB/VioB family sugar acetyltransferase [Cellvibrionaceae bacterium]
MSKPVIILGGGGHASVLVDILVNQGRDILALISPNNIKERRVFDGLKHYASDDYVLSFSADEIELVNGIGSLPGETARFEIYKKFTNLGYVFSSVISSASIVSKIVELSNGVQIMPGAIINAGVIIGGNTIINSGAIIEHDCRIGENNHIAPGVSISGNVITDKQVHVGTGASIIQNIELGENVVVGAGAIVTCNVPSFSTVYSYRAHITGRYLNNES